MQAKFVRGNRVWCRMKLKIIERKFKMSKITKDMGLLDIIQSYPETVEVFQRYGFGCLGCAAARFENL